MLKSLSTKGVNILSGKVGDKLFGAWETPLRSGFRGFQLVLAIIVIGLYGRGVDVDRRAGKSQDPAWIFALIVSGSSGLTALSFAIPQPFWKTAKAWAWDLVLAILWIILFGIFAAKFLNSTEKEVNGKNVGLMKAAMWLDLVNCILWVVSGVYGLLRIYVPRKVRAGVDKGIDKYSGRVVESAAGKLGVSRFNSHETKDSHSFDGNEKFDPRRFVNERADSYRSDLTEKIGSRITEKFGPRGFNKANSKSGSSRSEFNEKGDYRFQGHNAV